MVSGHNHDHLWPNTLTNMGPQNMKTSDLTMLRIPGIFPVAMLEYGQQQGVEVASLLASAGVRQPLSVVRESGLLFPSMRNVLEALSRACNDPALGFRAGCAVPMTALGPLGFGMMSADNIESALMLAQRYWDLAGRVLQMEVITSADICEVRFETEVPFDDMVRRWALESGVACARRAFALMHPLSPENITVLFALPAPAHEDEVRSVLGNVVYGAARTAIRIPVAWLAEPMPMRSVTGYRHAIEQCEAQLALWHQPDLLKIQVQRCLRLTESGYPTLKEVARQLCLSSRTLRRRLLSESSSFAELLESARRQDAMQLLQDSGLNISGVAQRLGYHEPGNFTRAFRSWTGITPTQWRLQFG